MSEAKAIGESTVQGFSTVDFGQPWTLLTDGTIKELGFRLHAHATAQVLRNDQQGKHYRKALWDANQRTITAKKKIPAQKSKVSQLSRTSTAAKPCNCGGKLKALAQLQKAKSKSSTNTPQEIAQSSLSHSQPYSEISQT